MARKILTKKKLSIALIHVLNKEKDYAMNKDLNAGFGTADDYGNSLTSRMIRFIKKKSIRLPIISLAFLQAILKEREHEVRYFEGELPEEHFDLVLIYGTLVDYRNEVAVGKSLKESFPKSRVGFTGPFPSVMPEQFDGLDFVLRGEAEAFFLNEFKGLSQLEGIVQTKSAVDMEVLPNPCFDGFPIQEYGYAPAITKKPFLVLQASRGCPFSCRFYCTYGQYQGATIRQRSPQKVVDDIISLQKRYGVRGIQFRDPTFGLKKDFITEFCRELKKRGVEIEWGMETHLNMLNEENLKMMYGVGLRNINVGIETNDPIVAAANKRKLIEETHQEKIIRLSDSLGIHISAFYMLAYEEDTAESITNMVTYATKLNTPIARFAVCTPYPGTGFYQKIEDENRTLTKDYEKYTQFNLVFKHKNLTAQDVRQLLEIAYRRYYFRPSYVLRFLGWKLRKLLA